MFDKRITIFTGHFGSGKTEVAINYALQTAERGEKTAIVDLDIVNPFFRTADVKNSLEEKGVKVITPVYANTNVDVPALPAEINSMFEDRSYTVILDVGGDDLGARAVSRYKDLIVKEDYIHYFVINTRRPMTRTTEEIERMIWDIQAAGGIDVDKLVNNANLLELSSPQLLGEASAILLQVSEKLSIPVGFISGMQEVLSKYSEDSNIERLYMKKSIRLPWED
jgi:RecA/RadA recombinase